MKLNGLFVTFAIAAGACASGKFYGPSPYLQTSTGPWQGIGFQYFHLENFESGSMVVPGVTKSAGSVISKAQFGTNVDSVDGDDGVLDGKGFDGRSLFSAGGSTGITFTFDATALGALPTYAGIVWTDGASLITFEAFDALGVSLGTRTGNHSDGSNSGTTAEDRFYGCYHPGGISKIKLKNSSGGIEMDHLQYGIPISAFSISGTVSFSDLSDPSKAPTTLQVELRTPGTSLVFDTVTAVVNPNGTFTASNLPPGKYNVAVKESTWLKKAWGDVDIRSANATGLSFELINGDCDGNNSVGTDDYLILNASFDTSLGDAGFDARGDLNRDDYVGTDDYLILNKSFDKDGDD